ncbi:hypothetical protein GCM10009834_23020 [Streptomonospora arabica]|uniref:Uncharacterized protein n=1 Tax=Streptomonospora halophila TaxID=427369 RepID=A0ABP9GE83_9ACTN
MPAEPVGDRQDHRLADRQYAPHRHGHVGAGDGERTHDDGVLVGRAYSAPVREGRDRDFPTSDTHTPNLLFQRQYLPNSPKRRLAVREAAAR